jgi:hypothetical protein
MLDDVARLDRRATGEDRAHLIEGLATPETARVLRGDGGSIDGFVIRAPWGGVAVLAAETDDAIRLLDWRRRQAGAGHPVHAGIPETDDNRTGRLIQEGWTRGGAGTRMTRGAPLDWHPSSIWGHFSGAIG